MAYKRASEREDPDVAAREREYTKVAEALVGFLNKWGPDGMIRRRLYGE